MSPLETLRGATQLGYKALGQIIQISHWQPSNHIRSSSAQASSLRMISHNLQNFEHFSIQIHRLKHNGKVFHMPKLRCLSNRPCQQANKSKTCLVIAHSISNKNRSMSPSFLPASHWRSKWFVVYPPFLQIQHLNYKNHVALSLVGAFVFWILFQGKGEPSLKHKAFIESSNLNAYPMEGIWYYISFPSCPNLMEYKMSRTYESCH